MAIQDKMSCKKIIWSYAFSLYISVSWCLQVDGRKNIYQKDVSEYCRRRVLPSVFLSRHVMDAHAQMLHFSQLEVPYSCFLSIRAESGSNIILVIQLPIEESLDDSCNINQNQLLVYEMGETFGGYWGPLPDDVAMIERGDASKSTSTERYYTLKTTTPKPNPVIPISDSESDSDDNDNKTSSTTSKPTQPASVNTDENYVQMEIPLVDVRGVLVKTNSNAPLETSFDLDDTFDIFYNVQPNPGEKYDTSEMPLVQYSIDQKSRGNRRKGNGEEENPEEENPVEPRFNFQIDYGVEGVTQDPRLTIPDLLGLLSSKKRGPKKYKYDANKHLVFSQHKNAKGTTRRHLEDITKMKHSANDAMPSYFFEDEGDNISVSWQYVDELLDMLKVKDRSRTKEILQSQNTSSLLKKITNAHHNSSVYLASDLSVFINNLNVTETKKNEMESVNSFKTITSEYSIQISESTEHLSTEGSSERTTFDLKQNVPIVTTDSNDMKEHKFQQPSEMIMKEETDVFLTRTSSSSMVDHQSWENVVHAAPFLIGMLNNTDSEQNHKLPPHTANERLVREKRKIKSIQIKKSMPHHLSTEEPIIRTSESLYLFSDIQDFAQLVELPDDELYGHVAMRYLAKFVGSTLFNICEYRDLQRHVHLLNSSRIVVSINQFTMKRMTLVATPARTLLAPDARCPSDHIECQVSGARVCIDSMTACDGVPNCGSLDIYDEDRLACGALIGLQHNVYLTAFTFLAVLLTLLYIGHYWIKRCVPKVSDAFFVYRNGCENVLYLDTIMRSPCMVGGQNMASSGMAYPGLIYEDGILSDEDIIIRSSKKKKQSIFQKVCSFFRIEKSELETQTSQLDALGFEKRRCYSFAEEELHKMMTQNWGTEDACVQTGESLELQRQFSGFAGNKKSLDFRPRPEKKPSPTRQSFKAVHSTALQLRDRQASILRIPSEKGRIRSLSKLPTVVPSTEPLRHKESNSRRRSSMNSELNVLKFFRDVRSASVSFNPNDKTSSFYPTQKVDKQDMGTDYEKEIAMIEYGSPIHSRNYSPPGPSGQADMSRKRLRFDEKSKATTIGESNNDNAGPSSAEGLGCIDEEFSEPKPLTDFRRFWGNKFGNKSTKGKNPPRRASHF